MDILFSLPTFPSDRYLFNDTAVVLVLVIVDAHQQQIPLVVLHRVNIMLLLDLVNGSMRVLIFLQLNDRSWLIRVQLARNQADISEALTRRQFTDDGVILSGVVERQIDCAAKGVLIIVLQDEYSAPD